MERVRTRLPTGDLKALAAACAAVALLGVAFVACGLPSGSGPKEGSFGAGTGGSGGATSAASESTGTHVPVTGTSTFSGGGGMTMSSGPGTGPGSGGSEPTGPSCNALLAMYGPLQ